MQNEYVITAVDIHLELGVGSGRAGRVLGKTVVRP
jgi:hypothetical protein